MTTKRPKAPPLKYEEKHLTTLRLAFEENTMPSLARKEELAAALGLSVNQVQGWFERKRKEVRERERIQTWIRRTCPNLHDSLLSIPSNQPYSPVTSSCVSVKPAQPPEKPRGKTPPTVVFDRAPLPKRLCAVSARTLWASPPP